MPLYELPFEERRIEVPSVDDVTIVGYDFGGTGQPLVFAHATGLHTHTYAPLIELMRDRFHCYGIDVRAQGAATAPANLNFKWTAITRDFLAGLEALELSGRGDVCGIGHSQGGYSLISSALADPDTFEALYCYEPVVFPAAYAPKGESDIAVGARRRRPSFASKADAYATYKSKPPFSGIDDNCLRAYVEYGFYDTTKVDAESGDLVEVAALRCTPSNEAELFMGAHGTDLFSELGGVKCPVTVGCGEYTAEHFKDGAPKQAEALGNGTLQNFPRRSHFGILEGIDEMVEVMTARFKWMAP